MGTHKYRIFYQWQGRTASDPFAAEKSPDEIVEALERVPIEFRVRLGDADASVDAQPSANPNEILLTVATSATEEQVTRALIPTLQDWRLFGDRI